MLSTMYLGW